MRTMLVISRRSWARMRSFSPAGMVLPKNRSSAADAWATSMGSPSEQGMPRSSAWSSSAVRRGL